jgi:predicted ATPase|nr:hypothetical protein [Dolichospermum planctonicum]
MNSFERITIEGYRRLFNVQVDMRDRPLTVMIGANGDYLILLPVIEPIV